APVGRTVLRQVLEKEYLAQREPHIRYRAGVERAPEYLHLGRAYLYRIVIRGDGRDLFPVHPRRGVDGDAGRRVAVVAAPVAALEVSRHEAGADDEEVAGFHFDFLRGSGAVQVGGRDRVARIETLHAL